MALIKLKEFQWEFLLNFEKRDIAGFGLEYGDRALLALLGLGSRLLGQLSTLVSIYLFLYFHPSYFAHHVLLDAGAQNLLGGVF